MKTYSGGSRFGTDDVLILRVPGGRLLSERVEQHLHVGEAPLTDLESPPAENTRDTWSGSRIIRAE
jgi:hypothetical protein